jgi:hypothetical protein
MMCGDLYDPVDADDRAPGRAAIGPADNGTGPGGRPSMSPRTALRIHSRAQDLAPARNRDTPGPKTRDRPYAPLRKSCPVVTLPPVTCRLLLPRLSWKPIVVARPDERSGQADRTPSLRTGRYSAVPCRPQSSPACCQRNCRKPARPSHLLRRLRGTGGDEANRRWSCSCRRRPAADGDAHASCVSSRSLCPQFA